MKIKKQWFDRPFWIVIEKLSGKSGIFTTIEGVKELTGDSRYKIINNKSKNYTYYKAKMNISSNKKGNSANFNTNTENIRDKYYD